MNKGIKLVHGKLVQVESEIPSVIEDTDVVIKISHAGVCGTDFRVIDGTYPSAEEVILGHEFGGVVHEIGKEVKHVAIGDRVVVNPCNSCGTCHYCTRGHLHFCIREAMKTCIGFYKDGGWQNYCRVVGHLVFKLPHDMLLCNTVFCQPVSDILRGWDNMGVVASDSNILVGGAGIIGLLWASMFHYHGYRNVTISEPHEDRRQNAEKLGLKYKVMHPSELNNQKQESVDRGDETWGFDVIVDCTGKTNAIETQFQWLRKASTMVLFGCCPTGATSTIEPYQIYCKEIKLVSSYLNKFTFPKTVMVINSMADRYLNWDTLGVRTAKLDDYEKALSDMKNGKVGKIVFEM